MAQDRHMEFGAVTKDGDTLNSHKEKWESLATENDRYYVRSVPHEQSDEEYESSGRDDVNSYILNDQILRTHMPSLFGKTALEIGCGSGRITKTLAYAFSTVYAVDISSVMLEKAKNFVRADNVNYIESDGQSVPVPEGIIDLAFSYIVYQHFPSRESILNSFRGVQKALKGGGLFKVQIRGLEHADSRHWSWGPSYDAQQGEELAREAGFDILSTSGVGTRSFWLLLKKQ
jgi:SAM-dependent methyltransferase